MDNYVRFVVRSKGVAGPAAIYTNIATAGVSMSRAGSDAEFGVAAMDNINRALDRLVGRGFPKRTRLTIYGGFGTKTVETTVG